MGGHWLTKLHRSQVYNSITHYLYTALCVHHAKSHSKSRVMFCSGNPARCPDNAQFLICSLSRRSCKYLIDCYSPCISHYIRLFNGVLHFRVETARPLPFPGVTQAGPSILECLPSPPSSRPPALTPGCSPSTTSCRKDSAPGRSML